MDSYDFKAIGILSLDNRLPLSFDIFLKQKDGFVKYASAGMKITKESIDHLLSSGILQVYVRGSDFISFNEYMKKHLNMVLEDKRSSIEEKSKIIYESASDIMNELFSNPVTKPIIESAKELSSNFLNKILSDQKAFLSLLKVCSFDYYTYTHCVNVAIYSLQIAKKLKLNEQATKEIAQAAILHDLGKSKIEPGIINKDGGLTQEEFEKIKKHPIYGYEMLKELGEKNQNILDGIKYHHEKLDGNGYPSMLSKDKIPLIAQVITVADIFDALTTRRSYKPAMSSFQAFKLLKNQMKESVNQELVDLLIISMKN